MFNFFFCNFPSAQPFVQCVVEGFYLIFRIGVIRATPGAVNKVLLSEAVAPFAPKARLAKADVFANFRFDSS